MEEYETIQRALDYDPDTGHLIRKPRNTARWNELHAGKRADIYCASTKGQRVQVHSKKYMANHVVWLLMTGVWPQSQIEYINGDVTDLRWSNLRERSEVVDAPHRKYYLKTRDATLAKAKERRLENPRKVMWISARSRARIKGLDFDIEVDDIIVPETCPMLGIKLVFGKSKAHDGSPSLDRIDSDGGYTKDNIHVISRKANTMKSNGTWQELMAIAVWLRDNT